ncbi:hypothetical protein I7I53_01874 [Histoplasma capsulatum var. duboisii H88]|uniref:Uncharacterized protein n=1 Tax=Ajellomyces capsulatus (strain H88) TaxID=544711 RepID=A0A8A1LP23_AJEC8|nr:hypothetical protein I7I53_01874 [Histoplasma capsulatum var. duboisii H88]
MISATSTGLTFVAHHILAHELYQESSIRYVVLLCVVFLAPSTVQYNTCGVGTRRRMNNRTSSNKSKVNFTRMVN